MAKIVAIMNNKGGVGKTTTAINVSAGLARMGYKTLEMDLDSQASLTLSVGLKNQEATIYTALKAAVEEGKGKLPIKHLKENLDIIPSERKMVDAEYLLFKEHGREYFLKELISPIRKKYDYIILDCPPALNLIAINALVASDFVLVPVQTEVLSLHGLVSMVDVISTIKKKLNKKLRIAGYLMTQYDGRTGLHRSVIQEMKGKHGADVFESVIRRNTRISEAPHKGMDIFSYDEKSAGATDYSNATKELIQRI
ncbi:MULTISPECIES: ParA family protein [Bacteroides]|jgi:ATPase|uniref:ParA family protein n=1 Tax=Bacteroides TaxID=816 RepID=UPI002AFF44AF|nr:ParA family protein [Bacteroides sp. CG01]